MIWLPSAFDFALKNGDSGGFVFYISFYNPLLFTLGFLWTAYLARKLLAWRRGWNPYLLVATLFGGFMAIMPVQPLFFICHFVMCGPSCIPFRFGR